MTVPKTKDQFSDADLIRAVALGDLAAFDELYSRHSASAFALARRITWDAGLAEDIVQDAFLGAWRNAGRYRQDRGSVRTWLLAIVHHRAIDSIRRRRRTVSLPEPHEACPAPLTVADSWPEVAGRLDRADIEAGLALLSDVQRQVIELAYFGGLTQLEIAGRTRTPLGTIKSRTRLGLRELRRQLQVTTALDERAGALHAEPPTPMRRASRVARQLVEPA